MDYNGAGIIMPRGRARHYYPNREEFLLHSVQHNVVENRISDDNDDDDSDEFADDDSNEYADDTDSGSGSGSSRSRSPSYCCSDTDRGSTDGEEETDYDDESPFFPDSPPGSPPLSPRRRNRRRYDENDVSGTDRISELPEVLILNILSRLPIKHAVRTGVLSKRWSYLWTSVDTISISRPYHSGLGGRDFLRDEKRKDKFITFVDKTLVLCTHSNLKKFALDFGYERRFVSSVNLWVRFAMQKNIEEFDLNLYHPRPGHRYKLPQYVFANSGLAKLSLSKCKILPLDVVGWKSLKSLLIKNSEISVGLIQRILMGSPLLEFLELYRCYSSSMNFVFQSSSLKKLVIRGYRDPGFDVPENFFRISAPGIVSLDITGYHGRQKLRLLDVSSVVDAKLDFYVDDLRDDKPDEFKGKKIMIRNLFDHIQHAKDLTLGTWFMQGAYLLEIKGKPLPLSELKSLKLLVQMEQSYLRGISCLLRSSPALETLVIDMEPELSRKPKVLTKEDPKKDRETKKFDKKKYWTNLALGCTFSHLKTVKAFGFNGKSRVTQLRLVQLFLENAPVLDKLVITNATKEGCTHEEFSQVIQKVSSFPRSSPNVVIIFPQSP